MSSSIQPEYRLRNLARRLNDLLLGRRLSADSEESGVVDLSDYGKKCEEFAEFCAKSAQELAAQQAPEAACARRILEDAENAARLAGLLETLPATPARRNAQCDLLEEVDRDLKVALKTELRSTEEPASGSYAPVVRREAELFRPFVEIELKLEPAAPRSIRRNEARRALRRALLQGGRLRISLDAEGTLRFLDREFRAEGGAPQGALPRSADEPPEVRRALDLHDAAADEGLREFLLAKAAEEAAAALVLPRLGSNEWLARAREFPRKEGKRGAVRPESVSAKAAGWDAAEAGRFVEKLADRRAGPEWARLPKAAYPIRLLLIEEDPLAADLLALGPALRRMEKGERAPGSTEAALRALRRLLA
jgi:hypothetical protein